jgi:hypothetical protein
MAKKVAFKVSYHPSGRYTLMEKIGDATWKDVAHESDKVAFYRAGAKRLAKQGKKHLIASYSDSNPEKAN